MCSRQQRLGLSLTQGCYSCLGFCDHGSPSVDQNYNRDDNEGDVRSPLEAHASYRGEDWTPSSLIFHQNLESFAERVGLIVGLQSNGKLSQDQAYAQIRKIWKKLKDSKGDLFG